MGDFKDEVKFNGLYKFLLIELMFIINCNGTFLKGRNVCFCVFCDRFNENSCF